MGGRLCLSINVPSPGLERKLFVTKTRRAYAVTKRRPRGGQKREPNCHDDEVPSGIGRGEHRRVRNVSVRVYARAHNNATTEVFKVGFRWTCRGDETYRATVRGHTGTATCILVGNVTSITALRIKSCPAAV